MKRTIPKTMGTQHPDNVASPFFAANPELGGEDEVHEAYYTYSHLGCQEQMWDCEGKEVDNFVVKKLLSRYDSYFHENVLGEDLNLTLRVPNPTFEKTEAKILIETLESIPRSTDAARLFYGREVSPIFEVILPMADSTVNMNRIYHFYKDFVVGKQHRSILNNDLSIKEWMGEFAPETINVIPLFEAADQMLRADTITGEFMKDKAVDYQRVFLARSDPALNYGNVSAVLLNKIALRKLWELQEKTGKKIYPILGIGTAPFRGGLSPESVDDVMGEYPSVHTYSIQSAFKYDFAPTDVQSAIQKINANETGEAHDFDVDRTVQIVEKITQRYQEQVVKLAPIINRIAPFIPGRRKRKQHVGLFGYSRSVDGVKLPRAIKFTAVMHSLGMAPEILGLSALNKEELAYVSTVYRSFNLDYSRLLRLFNPNSRKLAESLGVDLGELPFDFTPDAYHQECTDRVLELIGSNQNLDVSAAVLQAASRRRFLG